MSAANGRWYQRLSKLKTPRSSACFVVIDQWNTTTAMTPVITSRPHALWPGGGVAGGTAPEEALATAGGGESPAATGPAGQSAHATAARTLAATTAPA